MMDGCAAPETASSKSASVTMRDIISATILKSMVEKTNVSCCLAFKGSACTVQSRRSRHEVARLKLIRFGAMQPLRLGRDIIGQVSIASALGHRIDLAYTS